MRAILGDSYQEDKDEEYEPWGNKTLHRIANKIRLPVSLLVKRNYNMSFVSIIGHSNFISIMSDGRVSSNNMPIHEDYQKFILLNDDFFIAFAGNKEPCEEFIKTYKLLFDSDNNLNVIAEKVQKKLLSMPYINHKILIAFGGKTTRGILQFCTFSTLEPGIQLFTPTIDNIVYAFLNNSAISEEILKQRLIRYLNETGFNTPEMVKLVQKSLNDSVAAEDPTVNTKVFSATIYRNVS